jgi:predicted site-specific integrase-resolvase
MTTKIPPLMRLAEASRHYGLSKTTLIRLRRQGALRVFTTQGKQHMFYRDDIENFLKLNSTPSVNEAKE